MVSARSLVPDVGALVIVMPVVRIAVVVYGGVHTTVRAYRWVVSVGVVRRPGYTVNMVRVMPVPVVPGGRTPVRHKAQCRQSCYAENSGTGGRITVYGATV